MTHTSGGMAVEKDVRAISGLLECIGVDVVKVVIMEVCCLGNLRGFAPLLSLVYGGAFDLRSVELVGCDRAVEVLTEVFDMSPTFVSGSSSFAVLPVAEHMHGISQVPRAFG